MSYIKTQPLLVQLRIRMTYHGRPGRAHVQSCPVRRLLPPLPTAAPSSVKRPCLGHGNHTQSRVMVAKIWATGYGMPSSGSETFESIISVHSGSEELLTPRWVTTGLCWKGGHSCTGAVIEYWHSTLGILVTLPTSDRKIHGGPQAPNISCANPRLAASPALGCSRAPLLCIQGPKGTPLR